MKKIYLIMMVLVTIMIMSMTSQSIKAADDYPDEYKNAVRHVNQDEWKFFSRECTSFVAWCLNSRNGVEFTNWYGGVRWSHAKNWRNVAESIGILVDSNPAVGCVAWWSYGQYGHVAYVVAVDGDEIDIEEYNFYDHGEYNRRTIKKSDPDGFIHIKDLDIGPHYVDLNWQVDGEKIWYEAPCATVDFYVDGKRMLKSVADICESLAYGSTYEIKNIIVKKGYKYEGVVAGSLKGVVGSKDSEIILGFSKTKTKDKWKKCYTGTWTYANIPSGFDMTHPLATKYRSTKLVPYTYFNQKLEIISEEIIGWIYYHWTSNCFERWSYNLFISPEYKWEGNREYFNFRAFDSTIEYGHYNDKGIYDSDCYFAWFGNPEDGSHWWYAIPIVKQTYKLYT